MRPLMYSERIGNEIYVYHNGKLIYRRWLKKNSNQKAQNSIIINDNGFQNVWII